MRLKHVSCGVFVNDSELRAFHATERDVGVRPGDATVFVLTNLLHATNSGRQPDEIDMVIISPEGVLAVEVKHWDRSYLKIHEQEVQDQADLISNKAKRIAGALRRVYPSLPYVGAAMLLTREEKSLCYNEQQPAVRNVRVYALADVGAMVDSAMRGGTPPIDVDRIARILAPRDVAVAAGELRRIGRVAELKRLSALEERFHRVYSGRDPATGDRVVLHLYDLSASTVSNAQMIARREFEAVQRLQKSPYLPSLVESFQAVPNYPGELFFFTVADSAAQSLRDAATDTEWGFVERIQFAVAALRALDSFRLPSEPDGQPVVHRGLNPDSVRLRANGMPLFAGWQWARLPKVETVAQHAVIDKFSAPELGVTGVASADVRSDVFSLCMTLATLFSATDPGHAEMLRALDQGLFTNPGERGSAADIAMLLEPQPPTLTRAHPPTAPAERTEPPPQRWDEGHVIEWRGDRFRVVSRLGEGGIGLTFKLEQLDGPSDSAIGTFVGKVVVNAAMGPAALEAHKEIRSIADHPGLSGVYQVADKWDPTTLVALLKWRGGEPMGLWRGASNLAIYWQLIGNEGSPDVDALVCRWAADVCAALDVLHAQGWVHGDLSPSNILVDDGRVSLIDFDLACQEGHPPAAAGTALYCSPERLVRSQSKRSDDVFALAASLFHVLTDRPPFVFDGVRCEGRGLAWRENEREQFPSVASFLDRAVESDPSRRFTSAADALRFLRASEQSTGPEIRESAQSLPPLGSLSPNRVPHLMDILRTYPGSRYGNVETRGLDSDFAHNTYVETELDHVLLRAIHQRTVSLVILCGNAGDGKTAFLQHLAVQLGVTGLTSEQRVWQGTLDGRQVKINLDGAASWKGQSADALLDDLFAPYHGGRPAGDVVHLVAVNDGRLMEWVESYASRHDETRLTQQLAKALSREGVGLDPHVRLVELNHRSLPGGLDPDTGEIRSEFVNKMVFRLIGGDRTREIWAPCETCSARTRCSMRMSAEMLGASTDTRVLQQGELMLRRLTLALQAVHQRDEVHITARELKAALSYIFFGLNACDDLHHDTSIEPHLPADFVFNPKSPRRQGELLRELTHLDPALESHARIDRHLTSRAAADPQHGAPRYPKLPLAAARRAGYLAWTDDQIQRVGGNEYALGLRNGRHFAAFREYPMMPPDKQLVICEKVCAGLSRLEALPDIATHQQGHLALRVVPRTPTETVFWVAKPLERFSLDPERFVAAEGLDTLPRFLVLSYRYQDGRVATLTVSLALFGLLMDLAEGVQILDAFSDDVFANLGVFASRLAEEDERSLRAWNPAEEDTLYECVVEYRDAKQVIVLRPLREAI